MQLLVRHGPPPGDTADAQGALHSRFSGSFTLPLAPERVRALLGTDGTDAEDPEEFMRLVRAVWAAAVERGSGHILIGICSGFEYGPAGPAASCGASLGGASIAPKGYVPLFAVARAALPPGADADAPGHVDIAVDYRNTRGPGDPEIRPTVFGGCAKTGERAPSRPGPGSPAGSG